MGGCWCWGDMRGQSAGFACNKVYYFNKVFSFNKVWCFKVVLFKGAFGDADGVPGTGVPRSQETAPLRNLQ